MPGEQQRTTGGILSQLWRKSSVADLENRPTNPDTLPAITLDQAFDELIKLPELPRWKEVSRSDPAEELTIFLTEIQKIATKLIDNNSRDGSKKGIKRVKKKLEEAKDFINQNFKQLLPDKQKEIYKEIKSLFEGTFLRQLENHKIEADDSLAGKWNQFGYDWKGAIGLALITLGVGGITTATNGIPSATTNSTGGGNSNDGVDPKYVLLLILAVVAMTYTLAANIIIPVKSGLAYKDEKPSNARKRETYAVDDFVNFADKLSAYVQEKTKPQVAVTPSQATNNNLPTVEANDMFRLATLDSEESDDDTSQRLRFSRSSGGSSE